MNDNDDEQTDNAHNNERSASVSIRLSQYGLRRGAADFEGQRPPPASFATLWWWYEFKRPFVMCAACAGHLAANLRFHVIT